MKERLPGYQRVLEEYTNQYLLFGYRKALLGHYHATILFQASKNFGGLTCEIGLSRTEDYPYYRFFDTPSLGVGGFRSRTTHVLKGTEETTTKLYSGPDTLFGHALDLVSEAISAGNNFIGDTVPRIAEQFKIWQPLYEEWTQVHEKSKESNQDLLYPGLIGEQVARDILHTYLSNGHFDSFLGPLKFKYRDPDFLNCHVYLLAKALAFIEPPEANESQTLEIDPKQEDPSKIVLDAIGAITGRSEQNEAIQLSTKILERVPQWAFLRSFAALEALYSQKTVALDQVKVTAVEPKKEVKQPEPTGLSLDELYGAPTATATALSTTTLAGSPTSEERSDLSPKARTGKHRPDPFEALKEYVDHEREPLRDSFEVLVAHLGF